MKTAIIILSRGIFSRVLASTWQLTLGLLFLGAQSAYPAGPPQEDYDDPHPPGAPTYSAPLALSKDDRYVWVVNPDNDSVSLLEVAGEANRKIAEVLVGEEPTCVAITSDGEKVYVTNRRSGTVSVIDASTYQVTKVIKVGTEPVGCALTPDGQKLFVANSGSDDVTVIRTRSDRVVGLIPKVGPKPNGIACVDDKVYVTLFLAQLRNDARATVEKEGRDDGKEGLVVVINAKKNRKLATVALKPLDDVGFNANGSVLDRQAAVDPPAFTTKTGAFPNLLHSIVVKGNRAYVPCLGSSPNGPFRFNVNVQSLLSVIDINQDVEFGQALNLNRGVNFEAPGKKLFNTTPFAVAFKHQSNEGFVVAGGVDRLVRVVLDQNGSPTINAPTNAADAGNVVRVEVGIDPPGAERNSNPQGIVINSTDSRAYVMNFITRDVSVVDISGDPSSYREIARIQSAVLPPPGTLDATIHRGNELFNSSIGPEGTQATSLRPAGRLSDTGWGNCYNCHPRGLHDGVTWLFPDGPRQAISMESTAEHPQPASALINSNGAPVLPFFHQRPLNWSAVRDEIQDFERNIRLVSGGEGLIRGTPITDIPDLVPKANTGRDADLDALAAYISFAIKAPISPFRKRNVRHGRDLFASANCQSCHGGPNWTRNRLDFTPPPATNEIVAGQLARFLKQVGTFDPTAFNEVRGAGTNLLTANGALGFNIPSLLSVHAGAPYLHSGAARTLEEVLDNVVHRSAGTGGTDTLKDRAKRRELIKFLESIDETTVPFP
jgi:YVTN family beta-propeller protein